MQRPAAHVAAAALAAVIAICGVTAHAAEPLRVLFVGNSLTYTNDLPRVVAAMPCFADGRAIVAESITGPDMSLDDHLARGTVARRLAGERWDIVILQQGPSSLDESRRQLINGARKLAPMIQASGARPAFYGVWPAAARRADYARAIESYRMAAHSIDATLMPAGDAWRRALAGTPAPRLYGPDGLHPSRLGTDLAALVICATLGGRAPSELVSSEPLARRNGSPEIRALLANAATEALSGVSPEQRMR